MNKSDKVDDGSNHLMRLINMCPEKDWNWQSISSNNSVTCEFIKENLDKDFCLLEFSRILTKEEVYENFGDLSSLAFYLSQSNNITLEFIENNDLEWNYKALSRNPNITWDFVDKNLDKSWDWTALVLTLPISIDQVIKYKEFFTTMSYVSSNKGITWDDIQNNDLGWDRRRVSRNPNITWDIVKNNPDYPWYYKYIACNESIQFSTIKNNMDLLWTKDTVFWNPNITPEVVKENPELEWNWVHLSQNPSMTSDFILENIDKPWNWHFLSMNNFGK